MLPRVVPYAIALPRQRRRDMLVQDDPVCAALFPDGGVSSQQLHGLPVFLVDGAAEGIAGPGDVSTARHFQIVVGHERGAGRAREGLLNADFVLIPTVVLKRR